MNAAAARRLCRRRGTLPTSRFYERLCVEGRKKAIAAVKHPNRVRRCKSGIIAYYGRSSCECLFIVAAVSVYVGS